MKRIIIARILSCIAAILLLSNQFVLGFNGLNSFNKSLKKVKTELSVFSEEETDFTYCESEDFEEADYSILSYNYSVFTFFSFKNSSSQFNDFFVYNEIKQSIPLWLFVRHILI